MQMNLEENGDLYAYIHSNFIYNSVKLDTTQISLDISLDRLWRIHAME